MPDDEIKINKIFSSLDAKHGLALFSQNEITEIENRIQESEGKYYIRCLKKDKLKIAKPEEIVRQLWINRLINEYNYPLDRIDVEKVVYFGSRVDPGAADIVVYHQDLTNYFILFEVKRPKRKEGLEQLKSYCNAEGAPIGIWSNGNELIRLHREEPNVFIEIPRIPKVTETLSDILTERWTLRWLEDNDELKKGKTTLKKIILDLEELVLGNYDEGFDEIFKLIYAKLYDEYKGINNPRYQLQFYVGDRDPESLYTVINNLLQGARRTWHGIFEQTDAIGLRPAHLKVCVSFLQNIKLFNSNLRIIDEAFEYLIPQTAKKKDGQFFTPRMVEDMAVKMLNPKSHEYIIDPACGSAGFLLHSIMWVSGGVIDGRPLPTPAQNFAQNNIYGIDFAKKAVRIAKAINLIVGDGKTHIFRDNSLAPNTWNDETKTGLRSRLLELSNEESNNNNQTNFLYFDFDILLTNPPFAGTIKEREILRLYNLGERNGRLLKKTDRHILFIERSLQFLRPGGRMAIVIPQGILNNTNQEYIRRFMIDEARILASVGLHINTFKPHTGTKTSVLFLMKYTTEEKEMIQKLKSNYETKWEEYIEKLVKDFKDVKWDTAIEEDSVPEIMKSFIESTFDNLEDLEIFSEENTEDSNNEEEDLISFPSLVSEFQKLSEILNEKESEIKACMAEKKNKQSKLPIDAELKIVSKEYYISLTKEIRALNKKIEKIYLQISERTLGGQIFLVLNDKKINLGFKEYWIDAQVMKQIDYPIFFAVNQKPLKDNKGEYNYKRNENKEYEYDDKGHIIIEHDLDEIAEAFKEFAQEQGFDFWGDNSANC
ncbi:MAG: N-6 DNA Methylase [Candidatus Methanofastidiosum methylothiophilum]|uniref:N-6 DNA Methylase n=1 Tax=Candidatus Methanofastidiosum methylothiophilum TaxID=1705564 RepID=A0A150JHD4_9EURY|nr:MAG: N-6 DNA Methylase [Candidatus Methanofastidiosum methylthiophilus]OQC52064.1 MAG: N-6 DNA Methylase [Euryarchaeota archaeon ADurb.Bin023]HOR88137.1 N-6 DNA methylase [Methanofastidiosum sp.]KYC56630.1 MAG: N-6 DNA Methylase [Candidatus Methanofastidiosum methylthiophilus]KYC58355.1 MAG: N-6 DNA Methylase [Candidatus Methanofastidiosum methylthiophilus]